MTRYLPRETYAQLAVRIEKSLTPDGVSVRDLASAFGVGQSVIRNRLLDLEDAQLAHHVSMSELGRPGAAHVWVPGPAPYNTEAERQRIQAIRSKHTQRSVRAPISVPHQITRSTYPVNDRRDPLVAALFGTGPGRSAS
jgi:hypothetical protein